MQNFQSFTAERFICKACFSVERLKCSRHSSGFEHSVSQGNESCVNCVPRSDLLCNLFDALMPYCLCLALLPNKPQRKQNSSVRESTKFPRGPGNLFFFPHWVMSPGHSQRGRHADEFLWDVRIRTADLDAKIKITFHLDVKRRT